MGSYRRISAEQAKTLMDETEATVVDVRDSVSYQAGHIADSVHLTNENVQNFLGAAPRGKPLIVYCYHGNASQSAAQFFADRGFANVYSLDGGFHAWLLHYPNEAAQPG